MSPNERINSDWGYNTSDDSESAEEFYEERAVRRSLDIAHGERAVTSENEVESKGVRCDEVSLGSSWAEDKNRVERPVETIEPNKFAIEALGDTRMKRFTR